MNIANERIDCYTDYVAWGLVIRKFNKEAKHTSFLLLILLDKVFIIIAEPHLLFNRAV